MPDRDYTWKMTIACSRSARSTCSMSRLC
jgi:hypothetical protein